MIRCLILSIILFLVFDQSKAQDEYVYLDIEEYKAKVYASWIGQIIGNTYGLSYEFQYIDEPGPDNFPYGYGWTLDIVREHNGAFSDDDTDIEYMYLTQMEEHGIEPTYAQLRDAWMSHVKERVWAANRQALTLMHAGHYPPVTGSRKFNSQWSQIDPQLVNEIWAFTAPGMIDYAVEKSRFAAKITNDDFGIEPTLVYAAMYSSAFFESDVTKLIEIGQDVLPQKSHFSQVIDRVRELHNQYPENWLAARKSIKEEYYEKATHNPYAWMPIDATLNGALGILALLYGEGDIQKTLDLSCALGMDADNQAATMVGLVAIITGIEGIPNELLFPLPDNKWDKPFNNSYKMITRDVLTDANLTDMAERMAIQGEKIILAKGGSIIDIEGIPHYKIPINAKYTSPFEFNIRDSFHVEVGKSFDYPVYVGGPESVVIQIINSDSDNLIIKNKSILAVFDEPGKYNFEIQATNGSQSIVRPITIHVHSKNLAPLASEKSEPLLADGDIYKTVSLGTSLSSNEHVNVGYLFEKAVSVSTISINTGLIPEFHGWFTSMDIHYRDEIGKMMTVKNLSGYPRMNMDNNQWLKPHFMTYWYSFDAVQTTEIVLTAQVGGIPEDGAPEGQNITYTISVSEFGVHSN